MISCSHFDEVSVLTLIGKLRQRECSREYAWREQKPRGGARTLRMPDDRKLLVLQMASILLPPAQ
jgi:hypothetical protein